jgi:hypothetical protein
MSSGLLTFDESAWPILVMTCPQRVSKESAADVTARLDRYLSRKDRFAIIVDSSAVKAVPDAAWRKHITDWAGDPKTFHKSQQYTVGTALIMLSPLARGIYTAIGWVMKHPTPQHAARDMADAVSWCCEQLTRAGVPRSRRLIELQQSLRM